MPLETGCLRMMMRQLRNELNYWTSNDGRRMMCNGLSFAGTRRGCVGVTLTYRPGAQSTNLVTDRAGGEMATPRDTMEHRVVSDVTTDRKSDMAFRAGLVLKA